MVLMCLKTGEEIGNGVHAEAVISFTLSAVSRIRLERKRNAHAKKWDDMLIPTGINHNIINASLTVKLKFYAIFSLPSQPAYTIFKTKADAAEAGSEVHNIDWGAGTGYL